MGAACGGTFTAVGRKWRNGLQAAVASPNASRIPIFPCLFTCAPAALLQPILRKARAGCKELYACKAPFDVIGGAPVTRPLGAVVLAAGLGTRMRSGRAKVLHELGGQPLIRYPLATLAGLHPERVALVVGHQSDAVRDAALRAELGDLRLVLQSEQRGT